MFAPSPTPAGQPTRLLTEAEAVCNLLMDMDVTLVARLDSDELLFQVGNSTTTGAVDLMKIARDRFEVDAHFREHMIAYLSAMGDYVTSAPGLDADLKTASAPHALRIATSSGLRVSAVRSRDDDSLRLVFSPFGKRPSPDAHLIMEMITERFATEHDFADDIGSLAVA